MRGGLDIRPWARNCLAVRKRSEFDLVVDVAIVGGGMAGMTLACALAQAGVSVVVVDREAPERALSAGFDGRVSAIALGSAQMLRGLGLWPHLDAAAQPILDIRITDGASPFILHYDHTEVGVGPLGYIMENRAIRAALFAATENLPGLTVLAPCSVAAVDTEPGGSSARVVLADGRTVGARLAVAADGRTSPVRTAAGIESIAWAYPQVGIVCTVHHSLPHNGVAHERFLPAGPFAMLPMTGNRCSLVWTERRTLAEGLMALDDAAFLDELSWRFGDHLGAIEVIGPRWCYPLSVTLAKSYVAPRLALVGDAAHTIHPIAGQGFNLGLRDIAALAEAVVDARRLGLDIGTDSVLRRYERWRRFDSIVMLGVTDGLNRLFSNDIPPIKLARDLGLAMVDRVPVMKRAFMRHAMGLAGEPPRLIRGEAL
ncbi:MAG: 2-octaprenyl-6-methoxyphenyl hydroxylase [Rhodospirillaceae bacterium]|nr:2-octaprenyl-6-methoxyphenyl hydroxylase [Rhodospirillaceae bacterium]